jgi:predicted lipoprotein
MKLQQTIRAHLSFFIFMALATVASAAEPPSHMEMVQTVIDKHIIPHVDALKDAAVRLPDAVGDVCTTGSAAAKEELSRRFRKVVEAYAGVDFLRFGPMLEGGMRERLSFWPDPRGFVDRQLRLLLLSKDEAILKDGAIAKQSVAVQSLPALEALMQDKNVPLGPGEPAHYRCEVAKAIAANIASVAGEIADKWEKPGGWKDKMLKPGPDNDTYKDASESAGELVKTLLTGLSLTADLQLKPHIDAKSKLPGPFERSGLRNAFFEANVDSLKSFYDALGIEAYLPADKAWMKGWVTGAWRAAESSDGLGGRAPDAQRNDAPPIREVFDKMNGLRRLINSQMCPAAKLSVGFNELDGD